MEFRSNRHYTKSVELALDEFKQKEQFDVTPATRTVKAGETLQFDFSGNANGIVFWSGEDGHDYEKSDIGGTLEASVFLDFGSMYVNGCQRQLPLGQIIRPTSTVYDEHR